MLFVDMVFLFEFLNFIEMHFGKFNLFFDFFFLFYQLAELIFERSEYITWVHVGWTVGRKDVFGVGGEDVAVALFNTDDCFLV